MEPEAQSIAAADQDLALTRAVALGDTRARRELADRLLNRTRATVRALVADDPDADDMVQLCLIRVIRSAASFRGRSRLQRWADRIVVRTALRLIRRRKPRLGRELPVEESLDDAPAALDLEDELGRKQIWQRLTVLLQKLPPERRAALTLRLVHDYRVAEIAEIMDTPLNTVRSRLRAGRKQLQKQIQNDSVLRDCLPWSKT